MRLHACIDRRICSRHYIYQRCIQGCGRVTMLASRYPRQRNLSAKIALAHMHVHVYLLSMYVAAQSGLQLRCLSYRP